MTVNISNMSIDDLNQLISEAQSMIKKRQREKRSDVVQQMRQLASSVGVSFELIPESKTVKSKTPPKYRNPKDSSQTWTGRGPQPKWYKQALSMGKKPSDLLI